MRQKQDKIRVFVAREIRRALARGGASDAIDAIYMVRDRYAEDAAIVHECDLEMASRTWGKMP